MSAQIYHSSFARYTLYREVVHILAWNHSATCANCGSTSHDHNGKPRLFKYSYEDDSYGAHKSYVEKEYCSVSCMRSYHNIQETA